MPSTPLLRKLWQPDQTEDIQIMNGKLPLVSKPHAVVSAKYPAQQASVALALKEFNDGNCCQGAGPDLISSLEIVLAEALNNVIEHACVGLDDRQFSFFCDFDGRVISITIEDNGRPFPGAMLPDGDAPALSVSLDELPEGGFGWFLIRSICSEVSYTREGSMNRLELKLQMV